MTDDDTEGLARVLEAHENFPVKRYMIEDGLCNVCGLSAEGTYAEHLAQALLPTVRELMAGAFEQGEAAEEWNTQNEGHADWPMVNPFREAGE